MCSCRSGCVYCESDGDPIPADHWLIPATPWRPPFAAELVQVMTAGGWTVDRLAQLAGMSASNLSGLRAGRWQPTPETGRRLAVVLDAPQLVDLAAAARTVDCPICRKRFVAAGRRPARFCSRRCYVVDYSRRRQRSRNGHQRLGLLRLALAQDAVAAFCRACEPDLVCKRSECPLRPISPLPLAVAAFREESAPTPRRADRVRRRKPLDALPTHPGTIVAAGVQCRSRGRATGRKVYADRWW